MIDFKKNRLEKRMTQLDVSKAVGVSLMAYQLWERGATNPTEENLKKVLEVLKV